MRKHLNLLITIGYLLSFRVKCITKVHLYLRNISRRKQRRAKTNLNEFISILLLRTALGSMPEIVQGQTLPYTVTTVDIRKKEKGVAVDCLRIWFDNLITASNALDLNVQ